jgi:hypothetical protein
LFRSDEEPLQSTVIDHDQNAEERRQVKKLVRPLVSFSENFGPMAEFKNSSSFRDFSTFSPQIFV